MSVIRVEPHFATVILRVRRIRGGRDYSDSKFAGVVYRLIISAFQAEDGSSILPTRSNKPYGSPISADERNLDFTVE